MSPAICDAVAGILDLKTGEFVYANAGHNSPITLAPDGRTEFLERPGGPILGVMDDAAFRMDRRVLRPGEVFLAYTDGVTEAANLAGEFFAENRLKPRCEALIRTRLKR